MPTFARLRDTPGYLRNGHFGAGLAYWEVSDGVSHAQLDSGLAASSSLVNSPTYHAHLESGAWIRQTIARSDRYFYPSVRYVTNLDAYPIGERTLLLRPSFATRVDGIAWGSGTEPFSFEDGDGTTHLEAGDQVAVDDQVRPDRSGAYRVGRVRTDSDGAVTLQIAPIETELAELATSSDFLGATYTRDSAVNWATITVSGLTLFERDDDQEAGFQPGDVVIVTEPFSAAALVIQVTRNVDTYTLLVVQIPGASFLEATNQTNSSVLDTAALTTWSVKPTTRVNLSRSLPVYQYDFTLALSHYPQNFAAVPVLEIVDYGGRVLETIPAIKLESGTLFETLSNADDETGVGTVFRRRLYRFYLDRRTPVDGLLRLTILGGVAGIDVSDVVLYKGNYTRRHDWSDLDDPLTATVADRRSSLDRLVHGADELEGVVPKGAVVLYCGGAQCPPGYKRADSLRESSEDGFELLPYPSSVEYDADRNRTLLTWTDQSFDLLDSTGETIPVRGDSSQVFVALPTTSPFNGAFETVTVGPVQQRVQPGMAVRIHVSNLDGPQHRRFDYSVPVRQVVVDRGEIQGLAPATLGSLYALTYPIFMTEDDFSVGERYFNPSGPSGAVQPTGYAATPGTPNPVGTASNKATFANLADGAQLMTVAGVTLAPLAVGEVVYVRWTGGNGGAAAPSGGFIAVITDHTGTNVTVRRYDGRGIVTDQQAAVSGSAWFSDAKVFDSAVTVTRTVVGTKTVWSARRYRNNTVISVFGDVVNDVVRANTAGILVESAGFLRFGDPETGFDYGDMGHSHKVSRGDAPFNENIAPHVSTSRENLASTTVARKHGHGYLPRHTHVIPKFAAFLLCEKL